MASMRGHGAAVLAVILSWLRSAASASGVLPAVFSLEIRRHHERATAATGQHSCLFGRKSPDDNPATIKKAGGN
jgi:hypothetical protein